MGGIDDHSMNASLIVLARAIYKHRHSWHFCQTLMHNITLALILLEYPAALAEMYCLFVCFVFGGEEGGILKWSWDQISCFSASQWSVSIDSYKLTLDTDYCVWI